MRVFCGCPKELSMGKKILIIEDNGDLRRILALTLRYMGYEPLEAKDGYVGIQMSLAESPDLVLLDLGLPGMSGIETAREIKKNPDTVQIPIVAYTVWPQRDAEQDAREAGLEEYLQKPASLNTIISVIERLTKQKASTV
jgi:CheY-like chemotaxis protein